MLKDPPPCTGGDDAVVGAEDGSPQPADAVDRVGFGVRTAPHACASG